jgi:hypothetical protein
MRLHASTIDGLAFLLIRGSGRVGILFQISEWLRQNAD